jgi:hypothetical protein
MCIPPIEGSRYSMGEEGVFILNFPRGYKLSLNERFFKKWQKLGALVISKRENVTS